jgi:hypothetical protein
MSGHPYKLHHHQGVPKLIKHPIGKILCNLGPLTVMVVSIPLMASTSDMPNENRWGMFLVGSVCARTSVGPFFPGMLCTRPAALPLPFIV